MTRIVESQIVAAKNMGFSIGEIRQLTVGEIHAFVEVAYPGGGDEPSSRMATQEDIDKLMR